MKSNHHTINLWGENNMSLGKVYFESDWLLCNTRNKDMGTIFEAGYFNCLEKPIVYFCDGLPPGAQFNLMLAASGIKVCRSLQEFDEYLSRCSDENELIIERYQGEIE
jgi:hypothetical protein